MQLKKPNWIHPIHCPREKLKRKKLYYRFVLFSGGVVMLWIHHTAPDYEIHVAVLLNSLFAVDFT